MFLPIYVKDANSESRIVFMNDGQKFTANVWTPVIYLWGEKNANSKFFENFIGGKMTSEQRRNIYTTICQWNIMTPWILVKI